MKHLVVAVARDVRHALRTLTRQPTLVAGVVGTFALAIGANAAMLGVVTRLMLAPPDGVRDAERVVHLVIERTGPNGATYAMTTTSYPTFRAVAKATGAFERIAAARVDTLHVGEGAALEPAAVAAATGDWWRVLGVTAALGRTFGPADDELPVGNTVVVLSHAYWQRRFAGDRAVLGRELSIDGQAYTIVGVAPRGFHGDELGSVDLFVPLTAAQRTHGIGWWSNAGMNMIGLVARLAPGVAPSVASAMAAAALPEWQEPGSATERPRVRLASLQPGAESRETAQGRIALWLSGVSLIVLLVATANAGTLLLLRAERRRRDVAVRRALGAGQGALARQVLVEGIVLASAGALVGLVVARWLEALLRVTLLPNIAASERLVEPRVLAVTALVALVAGVLAAASPLVQLARRRVAPFHRALVALQVALCTVLIVGAGLFVRSLQRVQSQDLGFSTARLLFVTLDVQGAMPPVERDALYVDVVRRVRGVPGVARATVVAGIPFGPHNIPPVSIPGLAEMPNVGGQPPIMYGATTDYLAMMDVRVRHGRTFGAHDDAGGAPVVLVNETMARSVWPGESALGKCVRAGFAGPFDPNAPGNPADGAPCRTVVGVVADSRARSLRPEGNEAALMQYYVPFTQMPAPPFASPMVMGAFVQITRDADLARVAAAARRTIQANATVPLYARVQPYQDLLDPQLRSWRLGATLFSAFASLALGIAAIGLFGVIAYLVAQRTREIGVRIALGAPRHVVRAMVVRDALRLVTIGVVAGTAGAVAGAPLVRALLFDTSPWDIASLAIAVGVLLAVTVIAALWPAWRAGRVDPLVALAADG